MNVSPRANLDRQLATVRSRWILRDALLSLARTTLAIVPACLVLGWLDYRLDFSRPVRLIELACLLVGIAWVLRRFAVPAITRRRDAYTAALRVESAYTRFGGRFVSRTEFRGGRGDTSAVSRELMDAMCEQVERDAATLPLPAAIDMHPVRRPGAAAAITLCVLCLVVFTWPGLASLWVRRTLWPFSYADWPRRTEFKDVQQRYRVRRGDPVVVKGRLTGEIPRTGEIEWQSDDPGTSKGRSAGRKDFDVQPDGAFNVEIGPLLQPISFSIKAGDARLRSVPVDVVIPPELASIEAGYEYPPFAGRERDTVKSGDVRALVGTRVELALEADRPVKRMELVLIEEGTKRTQPVTLASKTRGRASFVVLARGEYQVWLYDEHEFTTDSPATFVIDPIDNELPTIRVTRPGSEHTVTPATRLRLRFTAQDDYGVTAATIRWQKRARAREDEPAAGPGVPIPITAPRRQWEGRFAWDLGIADLASGDEVEYYVEVRDAGRHLTEQKAGASGTHVLKVVDPESLRQSLEARQRDVFAELDHLIEQQQASRDQVELAVKELPSGDEPLMPKDLRRVQVEEHRQARVLRQVARLAARIAEIADELADSFLVDAGRIEDLRALAEGLRTLEAGPMRDVVVYLQQARAALAESGTSMPPGER